MDKILTIKRIGVTMIMKTRIFDRSRSLGTLHSTPHRAGPHMCRTSLSSHGAVWTRALTLTSHNAWAAPLIGQ